MKVEINNITLNPAYTLGGIATLLGSNLQGITASVVDTYISIDTNGRYSGTIAPEIMIPAEIQSAILANPDLNEALTSYEIIAVNDSEG